VRTSGQDEDVRGTLTIARLTWIEARRRRIVLAAVLGGLAFLVIYGVALFFIDRAVRAEAGLNPINLVQMRIGYQFMTLAGLYVVNFLTIAVAIMLAVDTLSGEISSGVMQTLAAKPIHRAEIVLGKWLTYWLMTAAYLLLLSGSIVLMMRVMGGFEQGGIFAALPLMLLAATVMLTVSTAGGVRLTTITNGIASFAVYGIAFIGGWIEQIGSFVSNPATRYVGTAISLLSPADAMWRRAAYELQPAIMRDLNITPFNVGSVPSTAMIVWAIGFVAVVLAIAVYLFRHRPL
jgi:ABC-type transport system involved in multi-copper enzyme maturation permease subunit